MIVKNVVWKNRYLDSLKLMRISNTTAALQGVEKVSVVMATPLNKQILKEVGLYTEEGEKAKPEDMLVALSLNEESQVQSVLDFIEEEMNRVKSKVQETAGYAPKSLELAIQNLPDVNLALISVPGNYAKHEAMKALKKGLHVFLFSDNVSIEEEIELKNYAETQGLLVMGPGCGTAHINGVALGFANVVKNGPVGIVAAAGTGIQEAVSLLSNAGVGISHAIGTGGRDLSDKIGGITARQGLQILNEDEKTKVVILISKPPGKKTVLALSDAVKQMGKPVVVNFIGMSEQLPLGSNAVIVDTLEDAAFTAYELIKGKVVPYRTVFTRNPEEVSNRAETEWEKMQDEQRYVRGLFSGGTLCSEATLVLADYLSSVSSNIPPRPELKMNDTAKSEGHVCIDLGDEEFTVGRAHPMIDPFVRQQRLIQEAKDPKTAVILLDIVLGYGSHLDMAGALKETIVKAKSIRQEKGGYLCVVASVIGTDEDPQSLKEQEKKLTDYGVVVMPSNAQAARMAALIVSRGKIKDRLYGGK